MAVGQGSASPPEQILPGDPLHGEVVEFLHEEAERLDEGRLLDWLELLADDVHYRMPVRATLHRDSGAGFADEVTLFDDDKQRLTFRARRLVESPNAHIEMPPTRSRRFITNVRLRVEGELLLVTSSVLLMQSRWNISTYDLLSARRNDVLRRVDGHLKLVSREILIDQTVPSSPSLSVFI